MHLMMKKIDMINMVQKRSMVCLVFYLILIIRMQGFSSLCEPES